MTKANGRTLTSLLLMAGLPSAFWAVVLRAAERALGIGLNDTTLTALALLIFGFLACVCSGFVLKPADLET